MNEHERAPRYSDLFTPGGHQGDNCRYCPICTTLGLLRNISPEVVQHLTRASHELLSAATLVLEDLSAAVHVAQEEQAGEEGGDLADVRRIDIA